MRNPNYTPENGEPEWVYPGTVIPHPLAQGGGRRTRIMPPPPRPTRVTPNASDSANTGVPPNTGYPSNTGFPSNTGLPSNAGFPANAGLPSSTGIPSNTGAPYNTSVPFTAGVPANAGIPRDIGSGFNTGIPINIGQSYVNDTPNNTPVPQNNAGNRNVPGVPAPTGVNANGQVQQIEAQPATRQPAAAAQMNAQTRQLESPAPTGGPAPSPVGQDAILQAFIDRTQQIRRSGVKDYRAYINSFQEADMFDRAADELNRRPVSRVSDDMPQTDAGWESLVKGLRDAIKNLVRIESSATRTQNSRAGSQAVDSQAVKFLKEQDSLDIDRLVWKLLVSVCSQPIAALSVES